jgi:putative OPT family oligopeptide transporter
VLGWRDPSARAAILTVGTVVCIAASKAGDISQDLKTGQLVGATPARQQLGQFIGAAFACWAVAGTVLVLNDSYGFGSTELPAPQATLMKTVIEGVLAGSLPWGLVGTGAAFAICAMLAGLPGLSFAIGLYLPVASLTPIFVGGLVRRVVDARRGGPADTDAGVLAASGMIAGEGLAGVLIALVVATVKYRPRAPLSELLASWHFGDRSFSYLGPAAAATAGVLLLAGVCAVLYRAALAGHERPAPPTGGS